MNPPKTVLVIEDNEDNLKLIRWILEDEGHALIECRTAEAGLEHLDKQDVDIVLMDISLPDMNGKDATRCIRNDARHEHLPVIAVTAHAVPGEMQAIRASGVTEIITKPLEERSFIMTLRRHLGIT